MAIRKGDYKLVKAGNRQMLPKTTQLYNLTEDISEKTDLAEKQPDKVKELEAAWQKWNWGNWQRKKPPATT